MKVLVSGGAGFIGSHLVERLTREGNEVVVVDDLSNGSLDNLEEIRNEIKFYRDDVSSLEFYNWIKNTDFDVIYHLACFPRSFSFDDPIRDYQVNIGSMINLVHAFKNKNTRIIFSSNSGIYDTSELPINEKTRDNPQTPYDLNKLTSERYLQLYGKTFNLPFVIFRFGTVYGERQKLSDIWRPVVMEFIDKLSRGKPATIYDDGKQTRDFINVRDIVDALIKASYTNEALYKTMILGSGVETSINELYSIICYKLGGYIEPNREPKKLGDIRRMRYDCREAERILGWSAKISLEEGIDKILEWRKTGRVS